jgi:hypothetical protein
MPGNIAVTLNLAAKPLQSKEQITDRLVRHALQLAQHKDDNPPSFEERLWT